MSMDSLFDLLRTLNGEHITPESVSTDDQTIGPADSDGDELLRWLADDPTTDFSFGRIETADSTVADFNFVKYDVDFNGKKDHIVSWGYNVAPDGTRLDTSLPKLRNTIEASYEDPTGDMNMESHVEGAWANGDSFRPRSLKVNYTDRTLAWAYYSDNINIFKPYEAGKTKMASWRVNDERLEMYNGMDQWYEMGGGTFFKVDPSTNFDELYWKVGNNLLGRFSDKTWNFENSVLRKPKVYSNAANADLQTEEVAIDTNRGGTGTTAVVYKDSGGTGHYWDADGTF